MKKRYHIGYLIFAVYAVFAINQFIMTQSQLARIAYSTFQNLLKDDRIKRIIVEQNYISGELRNPRSGEKKRFVTIRIDPKLHELLKGHNIEVVGKVEGGSDE